MWCFLAVGFLVFGVCVCVWRGACLFWFVCLFLLCGFLILFLVCLFSICDLSNFSSQQTGPLLEAAPDGSELVGRAVERRSAAVLGVERF